jgi:hypothetical protein
MVFRQHALIRNTSRSNTTDHSSLSETGESEGSLPSAYHQ